jgi:hypothetical protein
MYYPIQLTTVISFVGTSIRRPLWRRGFLLIPLAYALASFALAPVARGVDPPPDGGYPGGNTAEGTDALLTLNRGKYNTAVGFQALSGITIGDYNTAVGFQALINNSTGKNNTAVGSAALYSNEASQHNTAIGFKALFSNTGGGGNTATGESALYSNQSGGSNTAIGYYALSDNISSYNNTAIGAGALGSNTEGYSNTAVGLNALLYNRVGQYNTANGLASLLNNTGSNNTAVGYEAGINLTTGSNNIDIGDAGVAAESATIRIGRQGTQTATYVAGISGATVPTGAAVIVDTTGHLGTTISSARFKDQIQPMDKASEAILSLKPVTFRYKTALDPKGIPQFGLVAEQVEKVNPDLVARDADGKAYTVRYEAVNAMLLNEFLKEHRKVEEQARTSQKQEATIAQQKKDFERAIAQQQKKIEALTATLKAQAAQIQKVSDQLTEQSLAPRVVTND